MRAINLLPQDAYAAKQRLPHAPVVLAAAVPVLLGAVVYLGYSLEHSKVVDRQETLGLVQSQIAALAPSPTLVSESASVATARTSRITELSDALGKQVPWDVTFDQISRVMPATAWLTNLTAQSPTPAGTTTTGTASATSFSIQGYTYDQATVADTLARLSLVPSLNGVSLVSTTTTKVGTKELVQFMIDANVQQAATP